MATTKTSVIGYFNPNEYPLQIPLSDLNITLQLQSKQYIVDRSGRLVNDPRLDAFVGKGKLARASDQKQQVDVILLRPVNDPTAPALPHQHSVTAAARFETKNGRVTPVMATPTAAPPVAAPPASYNPVRGMTVEQAKQLKLIRPTKPVPEDFGAEETTGAPSAGQNIPTIKYATDTTRGRKPAPLPAELAQPVTPQQAATIRALESAAVTATPDGEPALPVTTIAQPVMNLPAPVLTESAPVPPPVPLQAPAPRPVRLVPPPIPTNPQPTAVAVLPPPVVEEASTLVVEEELSGPVVETELPGAPVTETTATTVEEAADASRHGEPPPENVASQGAVKKVTCNVCNRAFTDVGRLTVHARVKHPAQLVDILAQYAE